MNEITIRELYEFYVDTLGQGSSAIRSQPDEDLLCILFEDFDVGAISFLHENSLTALQNAGFLDDEMVEQSKEIRRRWLEREHRRWTAEEIRSDGEWSELFRRCDTLLEKVTIRNSRRV